VKVVGLYVVRNEEDLLEVNLRHHFSSAIDAAIVIDNGSTDRTLEVLLHLSEEFPILVACEPGPYRQSEKMTRMARWAAHQGADWVLPIDADEFWTGVQSPLREVLAQLPASVSAVKVDVVNFVQRRDVLVPNAASLLTMTMTPFRQSEAGSRVLEGQVDNDLIGFVEYIYESKWISRAAPRILIGEGNHYVWNVPGDMPSLSTVACLHAPFRARSVFTPKLDFGRRILEGDGQWSSWHARRWWRLARQGLMDTEWAANSYADGALDVGGRRRELVEDTRLRETLQPFVPAQRPERPPASRSIDPALGAYLLALETLPGRLLPVDARVLIELDRQQYLHGIRGDIVEIGASHGRTASLFGYFVRHRPDRLIVRGLFGKADSTSDGNGGEIERHYAGSQQEFEAQYLRFHAALPTIVVSPSAQLDPAALAQACRLVHIGTSRGYGAVKRDIGIAQRLLAPGGVVIFDDFCEPLNPGAGAAIWEEVLSGRFAPICMTYNKLYGHWGEANTRGVDWSLAFEHWLTEEHDIEAVTHKLASRSVIQFSSDDARETAQSLTESLAIIPSLEDLEVRDAEPTGSNKAATGLARGLPRLGMRGQTGVDVPGDARGRRGVGGLLGQLTHVPPDPRFFAKLARHPRVVRSQLRAWQALRDSGLFNAEYYLGRNPDVAAAGVEPLWHYVQAGESEGRKPNSFFDPFFYRLRVPDVSSSDWNLLHHFFERGGFEGHAPSGDFDPSYYLALHPDVAASGQNPLSHYLTVGRIEGRSGRLED
jgi:hypothetical protein